MLEIITNQVEINFTCFFNVLLTNNKFVVEYTYWVGNE